MTSTVTGWRRYTAVLVAVLCLGLAGCGDDDDEPQDSGLPSSGESTANDTTSPSPETTPTPPPEPANIDNTSPAAAKAFARHVVDLINYSLRTLDVAPLREVYGQGCDVCSAGLEYYGKLGREDGHVDGGDWKILFLRYVTPRPPSEPLIDIVIKADTERVTRPSQDRPEIHEGVRTNYNWYLKYIEGRGWRLVDWKDID